MMQTPREMQAVHVERRISIHIIHNRQKSRIRDAMAHPLSGFCAFIHVTCLILLQNVKKKDCVIGHFYTIIG